MLAPARNEERLMFPHKTPLIIPQILAWADDHHQRTGKYPHAASGPVLAHPAETWGGINQALTVGLRGLPGGDSLARLLKTGTRPPGQTRPASGEVHRTDAAAARALSRPSLRVGDRATCLLQDCEVVVTSWTDALLSWPRCRPITAPLGHPSLLVEDELARAIRTESAAALMHWWSVGGGVVWRWRKALGVDRLSNPGSNRLVRAAASKGGCRCRRNGTRPRNSERQNGGRRSRGT